MRQECMNCLTFGECGIVWGWGVYMWVGVYLEEVGLRVSLLLVGCMSGLCVGVKCLLYAFV